MLKKILIIFAIIIATATSIYGCIYMFNNVEVVEATPITFSREKGYSLMSDKQYCADATVEYEYNGIVHKGIVEMDSRKALNPTNINVFVLKDTGEIIHDGLVTTPFFLVVFGIFAIFGMSFMVFK